jgi:UDP-2,3-diacylglucosamine hydrolase
LSQAYYFASDFHLGIPDYEKSRVREDRIIRWLDEVSKDAKGIFLVGDVFDFWFEYKKVVPKGYTRLLGKLAELTDNGVEVKMFKGNHDMWMFGYFEKELNVPVVSDEYVFEAFGYKVFVHHGDGLGPGDYSYKLLRKIFRNKLCQRLFGFLHPSIGMGLAEFLSSRSRLAQGISDQEFHEESEYLLHYCKEKIKSESYDYLVFGHRHLPLDIPLEDKSRYINLGEWLHHCTYARLDHNGMELKKFED